MWVQESQGAYPWGWPYSCPPVPAGMVMMPGSYTGPLVLFCTDSLVDCSCPLLTYLNFHTSSVSADGFFSYFSEKVEAMEQKCYTFATTALKLLKVQDCFISDYCGHTVCSSGRSHSLHLCGRAALWKLEYVHTSCGLCLLPTPMPTHTLPGSVQDFTYLDRIFSVCSTAPGEILSILFIAYL